MNDSPVVQPAGVVAAGIRVRGMTSVEIAVSCGGVLQGLDRRAGFRGVAGAELGVDGDAPVAYSSRVLHAVALEHKVGVIAILFVFVLCARWRAVNSCEQAIY
jgi:hypothetical protein